MKLTKELLKEHSPCRDGYEWYLANGKETVEETCNALMEDNQHEWANWLISRMLSDNDKVRYAVFAAEQVIELYEKQYPQDDRPRKAIGAAKAYLALPSDEAAWAAGEAARAAWAAGEAARAARAAWAAGAAWAAWAAGEAARAAWAAWAAGAAWAAWAAGEAAEKEMKTKIIKYGISLLEGK